jgi:hypothetical protein
MKHRRIPTWLLERVILDEVPPELADEVREILDESPEERARLAELERSNAEILAELPPARVAAEVARRAESARGYAFLFAFHRSGGGHGLRGRRLLALSSSLAVAAGAVLIAVAVGRGGSQPVAQPVIDGDGRAEAGDTTRVKGPPRLRLSRKRDRGKPELLKDNAVVYPGDRIEIEYVPSYAKHGIILSIDGRGVVNLHFPPRAGGSTLLEHRDGGKPSSVGHSYLLDDAPDYERFVFIASKGEIAVADMVARVEALASDPQRRAAGTLELAGDVVESWHILRKGAAP